MDSRSRTEYSILNIIAGVGGYIVNTILGFICRMVFVKCLAADYLGVNGLFTNILTMLSLAELGIGGAIVYALYKPLAENDERKIASLVKVYGTAYKVIGCVIGIIGICLMPFLNIIITEQPNISESIYLLYIFNLFNTVITYFYSYRSSLLIAAQQNYIVVATNYIVTILQSILQMVALLATHNYLVYLTIQTIGTYDLDIQNYITISFDDLVNVIDEIGGVTVFISEEEAAYYRENGMPDIQAGDVTLTGSQALAHARNRTLGNDFERTRRQRSVMYGIYRKIMEKKDPSALLPLINYAVNHVKTNMSVSEMYSMAKDVLSVDDLKMQQTCIPQDGTYTDITYEGMQVLKVDFDANKKKIEQLLY